MDIEVPIETKKLKGNSINTWKTKAINISLIKQRSLYCAHKKSISTSASERYKKYKSILDRVIRQAKAMETEAEILDADNDSQKLWSILNEVVDRKQLKHRNPERFTNAGKSITKPMAIADGLNKYFAMIGQKMADTIPDTEGYQQHVRRSYGLFKLARPNSEYVGKIMSKQQPKLSCGLDTINNKVVKQYSNELSN